jgi:hypothetical protein
MELHSRVPVNGVLNPRCVGARVKSGVVLALEQQVVGNTHVKHGVVCALKCHLETVSLSLTEDNTRCPFTVHADILALKPKEGMTLWSQPTAVDAAGVSASFGRVAVYCPETLANGVALQTVRECLGRPSWGKLWVLVRVSCVEQDSDTMVLVSELLLCKF